MLLAVLLLIKWVTLTIGATAPSVPRKEIHLQIPDKTDSSWDSSEINTPVIRSTDESTPLEFKGSTNNRVAPKDSTDAQSTLNPTVGNVVSKSRHRREAMNSSQPFLSKGHIPTTPNMNNTSLDNVKDAGEAPNPPPMEGLRDQNTRSGEGNDTHLGYVYDSRYQKKENITTNVTVGSLFPPVSTEIPNTEASVESQKLLTHTVDNKPSIELALEVDKHVKNISSASSVQLETILARADKSVVASDNPTEAEKTSGSLSKDKPSQVLRQHLESTNKPPQIKVTRRPTRKSRTRNNRKNKTSTAIGKPEVFGTNTTYKILNTTSQNTMLQDGAYQVVTSLTTIFTDSVQLKTDVTKVKTDDEKREKVFKNATSSAFSSSTTPDSHMNDPPFRGPNIAPEIDHFYTEKHKNKLDFKNPEIKKSSFFKVMLEKDHGKLWMPDKKMSGILWNCHFLIIGSLFAIIALYSFISLLRVNTFLTLLHTGYYILSNSVLLLLCLLRSLYLFYDPYNLTGKYPTLLASILPKITLPCLTTVFLFSMLSLFNSTETQMHPACVQRTSVFAFLTIFLFTTVICTEIAVWVFQAPTMLLMLELSIVVLLSKLSSLFYAVEFRKLQYKALRKQGEMIRTIFTKMHIDGAQLPKKLPRPTVGLAVNLLLFCSFLQILLAFTAPFGFQNFHFLFMPSITLKEPWIWWGFQLTIRIVELLMAATLSFVATQPVKHFEMNDDKFCSILMWFPCSSFADWFKREERLDFEAHSDNYANPQGIRNSALNATENSRRLQTNSLPTFRTPVSEVDKNLPMRTLPCSGRHTNHASAVSLLSYYRSKRNLSVSTHDGLEELERSLCNQTTLSSEGRNNSLRPASMLYKDNGFIRFRRETDPEQPMEMSDEDDRVHEEADTSLDDGESTKANVGSSFRSLLEGDVVQNTLSPFFQIGYKRRFRKMSRISIETTDYSADVSSDQLSNVVNLRNGLSTSALDFHNRKYGSTCSSESAANSFDVTFFLNSNSSPEMQTSPTSTTPASLNVCSAYRSETEDDKTSSVEGHEVMLRSVSPIVKRASSGRLSLNLNLHAATGTNHSNGHVNVACGTEDITPDSAVYLDMQLSRENTINPNIHQGLFPTSFASPSNSFTKSTDGIIPISPETASMNPSPSVSPTSQSLDELRTSSSYAVIPRVKKNSRGLLYKLRGSTFSLNAAIYGYEPLEPVESSRNSLGQKNRKRLQRSTSDRRNLSEGQLEVDSEMTPLGEFGKRTTGDGSGFLGDSGLLGDCGVVLVDVASQTEETGITECTHKTCSLLMKNSVLSNSQSHLSTQMVDARK